MFIVFYIGGNDPNHGTGYGYRLRCIDELPPEVNPPLVIFTKDQKNPLFEDQFGAKVYLVCKVVEEAKEDDIQSALYFMNRVMEDAKDEGRKGMDVHKWILSIIPRRFDGKDLSFLSKTLPRGTRLRSGRQLNRKASSKVQDVSINIPRTRGRAKVKTEIVDPDATTDEDVIIKLYRFNYTLLFNYLLN